MLTCRFKFFKMNEEILSYGYFVPLSLITEGWNYLLIITEAWFVLTDMIYKISPFALRCFPLIPTFDLRTKISIATLNVIFRFTIIRMK